MKSKPILVSVFFSAIILFVSLINVDIDNILPFKSSFDKLSASSQKQVTCLAENIYFEAAREPLDGQKAVAFVTFNRVMSGYGDDICSVVRQKTGQVCQFSWYCERVALEKRLTIKQTSLYNEIQELATHLYINREKVEDVTEGATYYHADYVNPGWKRLQKVKQIGRHIFYRSKEDQIDRNKGI
jgi:spore germination cell wall hydrolase CwlJ-like protein